MIDNDDTIAGYIAVTVALALWAAVLIAALWWWTR